MYAPLDLPPLETLNAALRYEPQTGRLYIRKRNGERLVEPGPATRYLSVKVGVRKCYAHRVAWKMYYGADPVGIIDHVDCDKLNNRIGNLRIATVAENVANSKTRKKKLRPLPKGVWFDEATGKYKASLRLGGGKAVTGHFSTPREAAAAYRMAAIARFGSFARFDEVL